MSHLKVGLFGLGVVGEGIIKVLKSARNADAEIKKICVSNKNKPRNVEVDPSLITEDREEILNDPEINLIVEVINDPDAAFEIVSEALKRGKPVVSGSKTMIARHLPELIDLQHKYKKALLYDASSCGSIPVIRNLEEYYDNDLLLEVKGILNGSSNYILSRVFDHNEPYEQALQTAIDLGFAESDPSFDIEGYDSLYKLIIITVHALGVYVAPEDIFTYGISHISNFDINLAREKRVKIKLVAQVVKLNDNKFTMFVMPEFVPKSRYIYSVDNEYNGVVIRGECYERQFMFGKGAGSLPTASSILSDMVAHHHGYSYGYKKMNFEDTPTYTTDVVLKVYVRYNSTPIPELLPFINIQEKYSSLSGKYVVGEIKLKDLIECREILNNQDVFIVNSTRFFKDRD